MGREPRCVSRSVSRSGPLVRATFRRKAVVAFVVAVVVLVHVLSHVLGHVLVQFLFMF